MNSEEMARRFKAMIEELDLDEETAMGLAGALVRSDKDARSWGVAFKVAEPPRPMRPFEGVGRLTFPELYKGEPNR